LYDRFSPTESIFPDHEAVYCGVNTTTPRSYILPTIVLAQFCCTSLWFAGNGVMSQLIEAFAP